MNLRKIDSDGLAFSPSTTSAKLPSETSTELELCPVTEAVACNITPPIRELDCGGWNVLVLEGGTLGAGGVLRDEFSRRVPGCGVFRILATGGCVVVRVPIAGGGGGGGGGGVKICGTDVFG